MKKLLITLVAAASLVSVNVNAQEKAGGTTATGSTIGGVAASTVAAGAAAAAIAAALVANSSGTADPIDPIEPEATCSGTDELADGVCIGTTVTVTQTGTMGATITVPVTFTYAPTYQ